MSVEYYCKVVSKDKSEIVAMINVPYMVRDDLGNECDINRTEDIYSLPKYVITKSEIKNKSFLWVFPAREFMHGKLDSLETEITDRESEIENLKLKLLLAKSKDVYKEIKNEIESLRNDISYKKDLKYEYESLLHDINYELGFRNHFFKNNREIQRDKTFKYRDIKDYDLYFFWS